MESDRTNLERSFSGLLRSRATVALVGALVVLCAVLLLRGVGRLESLELAVYDAFLSWRPVQSPDDGRVTLVTIGEADFQRFGFPIPDRVLADALAVLSRRDPRAVGIDLYRPEPAPGDAVGRSGWKQLAEAVKGDGRIVMVEKLGEGVDDGFPAPSFLSRDPRHHEVGFGDIVWAGSQVVRTGYLMDWDQDDRPSLSLSLQLALLYLASDGLGQTADPEQPEFIRIGATTIEPLGRNDGGFRGVDDAGYQLMLDYRRPNEAFPTYSLSAVIEGSVPERAFEDRVVLVGTDAVTVKDDFQAPHRPGEVMKGVVVHAQVADQLLRIALGEARPLRFASERTELLWIALWTLAAAWVALRVRRPVGLAAIFLLGSIALGLCGYALLVWGLWMPVVSPLLGWLGAGALTVAYVSHREYEEKRAAIGLFRRFSSKDVADELWRRRDEFMDGGRPLSQRLVITALLSDLKGYTEASEKMEPEALMHWVNSYMDTMTQVIEDHGGHVDDYAGDGIKANFGVPFASTSESEVAENARRAVDCALAMGVALERLNARWRNQGLPTGRQRIGLCTGPAVAGALGSADRLKYTSVGDTVNTAARLEGMGGPGFDFDGEEALWRILVAESTHQRLGSDYRSESLGAHRVKGKGEPISMYRIHAGPIGTSTAATNPPKGSRP